MTEVIVIGPEEMVAIVARHEYHAAVDPHGVHAFEASRREYMARLPVWCYVSGGRALHAFLSGQVDPVCGVQPMRGRPPHPAPWRNGARRFSRGYRLRRHGECVRILRADPAVGWRAGL